MRDYSQYGQQKILTDYFNGRNGFLVDVGAWDGVFLSNSRALLEMGWSGILFEPDPNGYCGLIENSMSLPSSKIAVLPIACSDKDGYARFYVSKEGTLSSLVHVSDVSERIFIQTRKISTVWKHKIDLLLIDVEGAELMVLGGVDWKANNPEMIVTEHNHVGKTALDTYMDSVGYNIYHEGMIDTFYTRKV
jgi:FkbM family methyltransferase